LVGPGEENYDGEVMKILTSSPIAQGLLGKKVGESVEVTIPRGVLRMQVVEIADA
jgi:transcription elongation factor GreA